jgi:HlyD family secretion protein
MKKYSKLIVAAIVALIFIGTFVFLYEKSQPKPVEYTEFTPKMADVLKTFSYLLYLIFSFIRLSLHLPV